MGRHRSPLAYSHSFPHAYRFPNAHSFPRADSFCRVHSLPFRNTDSFRHAHPFRYPHTCAILFSKPITRTFASFKGDRAAARCLAFPESHACGFSDGHARGRRQPVTPTCLR